MFVLILLSACFIFPSLHEHQCKERCYDDFSVKITDKILKSNIVIVKNEKNEAENIQHNSWNTGASGVIFASEGDEYYALTAYHVVEDFENSDYVIIPYGAPTYFEYRKNTDTYVSLEMYYQQFATAKLVFADEKYDLAVISFYPEQKLNALPICESNPQYNERITVISNPDGERFVQTYGMIRSRDYFLFNSGDELPSVNTLKHNAFVAHGSSGSAVLNEDMEIVGINIGGGEDMGHRFMYGAMVPCELINEFLDKALLR